MFNIGFGELAVICIVLIIAVGPERLPSMMKTLGKTLRTLRQASRDIRASTGIDELMREDFDLYAPLKPSPPRRPVLPAQTDTQADTQAHSQPDVPEHYPTAPQTVSREQHAQGDRTSVVVAPPPQAVGLPSDEPTAADDPQPTAADAAPQPAAAAPAPAPTVVGLGTPPPPPPPNEPAAIASNVDTLPRAPIVQPPTPAPDPSPQTKNDEPKQSGT
jgi:Tat protein translocase TatB subunit